VSDTQVLDKNMIRRRRHHIRVSRHEIPGVSYKLDIKAWTGQHCSVWQPGYKRRPAFCLGTPAWASVSVTYRDAS